MIPDPRSSGIYILASRPGRAALYLLKAQAPKCWTPARAYNPFLLPAEHRFASAAPAQRLVSETSLASKLAARDARRRAAPRWSADLASGLAAANRRRRLAAAPRRRRTA